MNKNEQKDNKTEEDVSTTNFPRLFIGIIVMAAVLATAKFFPEILRAINRLLQ